MKYSESNKPLYCPQTQSTWYRGTRTQTPVGVLWHSTGANNPTLKRYVQPSDNASDKQYWLNLIGRNQYGNDWNHIQREAGVNFWIGKLADGTVTSIQTAPLNYRAWGCGSGNKGSCNNGWLQFEICEDGLNDKTYFNKVYQEAIEITAYVCKTYNIDPYGSSKCGSTTVPNITCHIESHNYGCGSNHGDVLHWFPKYGKNMQTIRDDVAKLLKESGSDIDVSDTIKVGDLVSVKSGAVWYTGGTVPSWIRNVNWYVKELSGNRAVIDKSEDGKNSINSPIDIKYLTKFGSSSETEKPVEDTKGKEYKLVVACNRYPSAGDAKNKTNSKGKYEAGTYYIYSKYPDGVDGMYNISTNKTGKSAGSWINPSENKLPVTNTIKAGDLVSIKSSAVWYDDSSAVPNWCYNVKWYVESVSGSRAVLSKSEDGKNSINSPIDVKYLTLVKESDTPVTPVEDELYRVRITWEDSKTQLGAYKDLANAKEVADANADKGYKVFDSKGNVVYTPEIKEPVEEEPETPPVVEPDEPEKVEYSTKTRIVEIPPTTEDLIVKVVKGIKKNNSNFDDNIAKAFFNIGPTYSIYPLYAISQSILETGWFKFEGSSVSPEQHNYCGLGATGGGAAGASFDTIEKGVEAQYQHLYAYGCTDALPEGVTIYDPRYNLVTRGKATTWEELTGKWAVPGYDTSAYPTIEDMMKVSTIENPLCYGHKILNIADRLLDVEVTQEEIDEFYRRNEEPVEPEEPIDPVEPEVPEEPEIPDEPVDPVEPEDPDDNNDVPDLDDDLKGDNWFIALLKIIWNFIESLLGIK